MNRCGWLRAGGADRRLKPPQPVGVPHVDLHEPEVYAELCDRCHRAPKYDSQSDLRWGHRLACTEGLTCLDCHASPLHKQNLLAKKNYCMICHIKKLKPTGCSACHDAKRLDLLDPHPADYENNHSKLTKEEQKSCDRCHGSIAWCNTCHGK